VLYHRPFPLRIASAWDAIVEDIDGTSTSTCSASTQPGCTGTQIQFVIEAMIGALREGVSRAAHTRYEVDLAAAVCARFASIERVRFTNSGTEANLMALSRPGIHRP